MRPFFAFVIQQVLYERINPTTASLQPLAGSRGTHTRRARPQRAGVAPQINGTRDGQKGPEEIDASAEDYDRVIAWCYEHNYLDDNRFIARFIASRSRKGYGPQRIRQELNQKGINREATERAMRECEIDWCEQAREQAVRKYGEPLPKEFSEK